MQKNTNEKSSSRFNNVQKRDIIIIVVGIILVLAITIPYFLKSKENEPEITYNRIETDKNEKEELKENSYYLGNIIELSNLEENSDIVRMVGRDPEYDITKLIGKHTGMFREEEVYQGKGIRLRRSFGKIVYVVFTGNYNEPIINGVYTYDDKEDLEEKLSDNLVIQDGEQAVTVVTDNYSITFNFALGEVIMFPNIYDDQKELIAITKELSKTKDFQKYVPMITDSYRSYSRYEYEDDSLLLVYPTLGYEIQVVGGDYPGIDGINIYDNNPMKDEYENIKAEEKNLGEASLINIIDDNLIRKEANRALNDKAIIYDSPFNLDDEYHTVSAIANSDGGPRYTECFVINYGDNFEDEIIEPYNLNDSASADAIYIDEHYIYYGISESGIYMLEPKTGNTTKLVELRGDISSIESVTAGKIVYNNGNVIKY